MEAIKDTEKSFHNWHCWTTHTVLTPLPFSVSAGLFAFVWIGLVRVVRGTAAVCHCCQDSILLFLIIIIVNNLTGNKTAGTSVHASSPVYFRAAANGNFLMTLLCLTPRLQGQALKCTRQLLSALKASIYGENIDLSNAIQQKLLKNCQANLDLFKGTRNFT